MSRKQPAKIAAGWLTVLGMAVLLPAVQADTPSVSPQDKVFLCVACHGADGIGKAQQYPNLRGQKATYLEKQLRDFRSGERDAPHMQRVARDLTDEDITELAAFFAQMNPDMSK